MRLIRVLSLAGLSAATAAGLLVPSAPATAATAPAHRPVPVAGIHGIDVPRVRIATPREGVAPQVTAPSSAYRFLIPGNPPGRWNPCARLTYKVNLNGMPSAELTRVKAAAAVIASALGGARIEYAGTTTTIPQRTDDVGSSRASVVLAFATPGTGKGKSRMLPGGSTAGMGGFALQSVPDNYRILRGYAGAAVFDKNHVVKMTAAKRSSLYLHELGHVFGLDHVNYKGSVMYPVILGVTRLSPGDRTGFQKLGRTAGCLNDASPVTPVPALSGTTFKVSWPAASATSGRPTYRTTLSLPDGSSLNLGPTTATSVSVSLSRLLSEAREVDPATPVKVTVQVTTTNPISTKAGPRVSFTLPKAVEASAASAGFDFATGSLVMTPPRWTLSGVRLPVEWSISGSVKCTRPDGAWTSWSGHLGWVWSDEPNTTYTLPTDCISVDLAADMKVETAASRTPVSHLTQTFDRPDTTG
ncbi:matrixin family metalloprotease [Streptomyces sp. NPDC093094]|uniref:matrixin family metalloprotease n=1 Tax=Streptomyces sp. NPDC093094 TaxID=3366026 RepID=UPI00381A21C4